MDPIRPIGPSTGDDLRVIPVAPARIRERDAEQRRDRERRRNQSRERHPDSQAPEAPGRVDLQA